MSNKRKEIQDLGTKSMIDNDFIGIWDIAPRVGKTKILIDAIRDKLTWNVAVSSPYEPIRKNWNLEFTKWDLGFKPLSVCSRSLSKIPENLDLLVIDEVQTLSLHQMKTIKSKKPKRVLGLTGTLAPETMLEIFTYLNIKPVFKYSIEQAIEDGIISNFNVYVILVELDNFEKTILTGGNRPFRTTEKKYYDYLSEKFEDLKEKSIEDPTLTKIKMKVAGMRTRFLYAAKSKIDIAKQIVDRLDRTIVFTGLTDIADLFAPSYHSKNKKLDHLGKFINNEIDKCSVAEMVNMGITIPNLKKAVVHQLKSDSEMSCQKILRVCNLEDDKNAEIFITTYDNTVDLGWTMKALKGIKLDKVNFIKQEDFMKDGIMGKRQEKFNDLLSLQ